MLPVLAAQEAVALAVPLVAGLVVGALVDGDSRAFLLGAAALVVLPFLDGLMFWRWELAQGLAAEDSGAALRRRLLAHLMSLPVPWFAEARTGAVLSRATSDVKFLVANHRVLFEAVRGLLAVSVVAVILLAQHPLLPLVLAATMIPFAINLRLATRTDDRASVDVVDGADRMHEYFRERLDILPLTRSSGARRWELRECERMAHDVVLAADVAKASVDARNAARIGSLEATGRIALLIGGGLLVVHGEIGVGAFVMAYGYTSRVSKAVVDWNAWHRQRGEARERRQRISAVFSAEPEPTGTTPAPDLVDVIDLRQIRVDHPGRPAVLDVPALTLHRGQVVAVVGASGGGKSTLLDVLSGLIRPDQGTIVVDGSLTLEEVDREQWRRRVTYMPQFPYFFTGSLRENLYYGHRAEPDEDRTDRLAAELGLDPVLQRAAQAPGGALPRAALSGGERQRLCLLRACQSQRPLMALFDEPTSALDSLTEERAMKVIRDLGAAGPVVFVAHRLSTLRYADRVLLLDGGRLVEDGDPQQLLRQGGVFAAMCARELEP
ncbi:ABC transporter ATP-binding protein [Actinoplanes xinjiangensis]|uniref:ABC transporter ATP-binding protein n=1 Tax=Actinoplanes xinjiangensis TaxID=512350 RepID=UPI00130D6A11|nr:ABC transporter ATP-binding protein [Actinoplanes xinjiangensis]